jgi:hypothetical protein
MIRSIVIAGVLLLLTGSAARAQDKFYAIIFGQEDGRNRFCEAHTFATFVRVRLEVAGPEVVDQATISWLPAAGRVKLFKRAERGRNYTLEESFALVKPGHNLAQWGPFEIQEELFDRAKKQAAFLSSGGVLYKAVDPFTRPAGVAINCEHAVCDIGLRPGESILRTGTAHGHGGSYMVAQHLRSWMIEPGVSHDWVNRSLKLEQYAIARGGWEYQGPGRTEPPTIAVAVGAAQPTVDQVAKTADQTAKQKTASQKTETKTEKKADPTAVAGGGR